MFIFLLISILKGDETWDKEQKFTAHDEGINSVVWGPVLEGEDNNYVINLTILYLKLLGIKRRL